jgi:RimJ/RimL family protein N-acetyltransferase
MRYVGFYKHTHQFTLPSQARDFFDQLKGGVFFGIYFEDKLIGWSALSCFENETCEFGIFLGEKEYWGRGIGTSITKQVCGHAFKELNIKKIYLTTAGKNIAGQKCYSKAGFRVEATIPGDRKIFLDGIWQTDDTIKMTIDRPFCSHDSHF